MQDWFVGNLLKFVKAGRRLLVERCFWWFASSYSTHPIPHGLLFPFVSDLSIPTSRVIPIQPPTWFFSCLMITLFVPSFCDFSIIIWASFSRAFVLFRSFFSFATCSSSPLRSSRSWNQEPASEKTSHKKSSWSWLPGAPWSCPPARASPWGSWSSPRAPAPAAAPAPSPGGDRTNLGQFGKIRKRKLKDFALL